MNVPSSSQPEPRPFVGVQMRCCNVYVRVYLNAAGDAFVGWCPRCAAQIRMRAVKDGGSESKFFTAQ